MRSQAIIKLLLSVAEQTLYPDQILIIDGSLDTKTKKVLEEKYFEKLSYHLVTPRQRGLTKQRNFGIALVTESIDVVCFLDDDVILKNDYFEQLIKTYQKHPEALGVGGYIIEDTKWEWVGEDYNPPINEFYFDEWKIQDSSRFILRKKLGLDSDCPPGYSSMSSHGRSVGFLPPSGKIYPVEMLMGGVSSFRKETVEKNKFSEYFEGYGLYEDADFCLRVAKEGILYLNTSAKLYHYHESAGRPDQYQYGKMVVRNGWYVWRTKNPKPTFREQYKWHAITLLLIMIRFTNAVTSSQKKAAFTEALGRTIGWWSLWISKPKIFN